jgi:hypothetical protein
MLVVLKQEGREAVLKKFDLSTASLPALIYFNLAAVPRVACAYPAASLKKLVLLLIPRSSQASCSLSCR